MKILHTADWHLGARLGRVERLPDQLDRVEEIVNYALEYSVDALVVAGDVFDEHRAEELGGILGLVGERLNRLVRARIPVVFIAGNHDREYVFPLLQAMVGLIAEDEWLVSFVDRPELRVIGDLKSNPLVFGCLPYPTPSRYGLADRSWKGPAEKRLALADAVKRAARELADAGRTMAVTPIGIGHFLVAGIREGLYQLTEEEDVPVDYGGGSPWPYFALGHIHKPQAAGNPVVRYSGSLERMNKGEKYDQKIAIMVDVDRTIIELPLNAVPLVDVEATCESDLRRAADEIEDLRSLVYVTLTVDDDGAVAPLVKLARDLFPRMPHAPRLVTPHVEVDRGEEVRLSFKGQDPVVVARRYLEEVLVDDPEREDLLAAADEILEGEG